MSSATANKAAQTAKTAKKVVLNNAQEMEANFIRFQRYCQLSALAVGINLPLGAWRINVEPYSPQW